MAHPVTAQCGTPGRVSLLCFGVLLVQQAILPRAQADAIGFDQALALGAGTPAVAESRDMLEARKAGDQKMRGTAEMTHIFFMPGAILAPAEAKGFDMQATITQGWNLRDLGGARRESAGHERGALAATVRARALRARLRPPADGSTWRR